MRLFPHVLIRTSGGSFDKLETLNTHRAIRIVNDLYFLKNKLKDLKYKISDDVYYLISSSKDPRVQNLLLNFKRAVFNERRISSDVLALITPNLTKETNEYLATYLNTKEEIQLIENKGEKLFSEELKMAKKNLHNFAKDDNLLNGLVLSSQSLLKRVLNYLSEDSRSNQRQDSDTEYSLIKYISRMYAKTSPFSTFTNIAIGQIVPSMGKESAISKAHSIDLVIETGKKPKIESHIRLNNSLYKYLKYLITKNPEIYRRLLLRPNPTIIRENNDYVFLINSNNIESFQRISINSGLELFYKFAAENVDGLLYNTLVKKITDYIDIATKDIEAYINQLIEYGFLEFNLGVSGTDPDWDMKLREKFQPLAENLPIMMELLDVLERVRKLAMQYEQTTFNNRKQILQAAYNEFKSVSVKLLEATNLPEDEKRFPKELDQTKINGDDERKNKRTNQTSQKNKSNLSNES